MPYPICSVVAVFKMLIRILNTLRSRIWNRTVFLFSVFWYQKDRISHDLLSLPLSLLKIIEYIPCGAKAQKIKRIDHRKCNVGASKNAEKAFSTQRYLYICDGLFFLFSSLSPHKLVFNLF